MRNKAISGKVKKMLDNNENQWEEASYNQRKNLNP
jgi:hypothetical protein